MKVLVACPLPETALAELRVLATDVVYQPNMAAAELADALTDVGILVVGTTRVSSSAINKARQLQLIVRYGTPHTNISLSTASSEGIFVSHCPDLDATSVAEWMLGMMLVLDRQLLSGPGGLEASDARGLAGRTLGILGFGAVGRRLATRAAALDMKVLAWSATLTPERAAAAHVEFSNWPRELARSSDILAVYAPYGNPDELAIDSEFLQSLRPGAYLIYVGQSATLNEAALAKVVKSDGLRVAIDWQTVDPGREASRAKSPLRDLPNVILTSNASGNTEQAKFATAAEVTRIVRQFLISGEVRNCVNLLEHSPATWQLVLRVRDQVGVMASVLDAVRADGINAEEITSRVFTGAKAAWCTIALDERPSAEALAAIRDLEDVLHLDLRAVL